MAIDSPLLSLMCDCPTQRYSSVYDRGDLKVHNQTRFSGHIV
ncbi:hypothetical protein SBF1_870009 [Candidatus Desulfosporosinus infrequens]|uniref:Uncharacterized protein n=1 Tax=Candidatus Desulfosporosinus infrequens TaxID=2043169 RepID=A0A2U3LVF9_9FIRM|nr:hypothetical protein SBF1_870009 [Candidatus Desulfosporosinus infrequens]